MRTGYMLLIVLILKFLVWWSMEENKVLRDSKKKTSCLVFWEVFEGFEIGTEEFKRGCLPRFLPQFPNPLKFTVVFQREAKQNLKKDKVDNLPVKALYLKLKWVT